MKKIQRTVIVTGDGQARTVGEGVAALFAGDGEPAEAVAVLGAGEADFAGPLKEISQISARDKLADKGWALDRLGEVAVIQVVDTAALFPVKETAAQISEVAYRELRLAATHLILVIVPELDGEAKLLDLTGPYPVVGLSPICEQGVMDSETFRATCARLIHVLVTTPLRDSLTWLAEANGHQVPASTSINSMGLAIWEWSPEAERERLAWRWVKNGLDKWRRPPSENEESVVVGYAHHWLASLEPEQIARHCGSQLPPPVDIPAWSYPQPWHIHEYFQNDGMSAAEPGEAASAPLLDGLKPAPLVEIGREILEAHPVAGPGLLRHLIQKITSNLEALGDRLADREDIEAERMTALSARQQALEKELTACLADWPQPGIRSWFRVITRPWRWSRLAWDYRQMRKIALALNQVTAEKEQWQRQREITRATAGLYQNLEKEVTRFFGMVEELEDMLGAIQQKTDGHLEQAGKTAVTEVLYWQLTEGPAAEAEQAAAAIGGLGHQLSRPDDGILEALFSAGLARMGEVQALSTADVLLLLYPTPDGLAGWWQSQMDAAAPLWRDDQGLSPAQMALTLVCGAGVLALGQLLDDQAGTRWIETPDLRRVTLLHVRGPVVIEDGL